MLALNEVRVLPVLLDGCGAHEIATFHAVMKLRAGKRILRADFADLQSRAIIGRVRSSNGVGIEASAVSDLPRARAAVAKVNGDTLVGMPRNDPGWSLQGSPFVAQLDDVGKYSSMFSTPRADLIRQTQTLCSFWTYEHGIVPGQLGQRFRQLLQPTVVGKATVKKRRVGLKRNFQGVLSRALRARRFRGSIFRNGCSGTSEPIDIGKRF